MKNRGFLMAVLLVGWSALSGPTWSLAGPPSSNRETPLVKAIRKARSAVVNIQSQKEVNPLRQRFHGSTYANTSNKLSGMGTGVVVDPRGYILTNFHVIEEVSSLKISLDDGSSYPAVVVSRDPQTDLALLRIFPQRPLAVMPLGRSHDLMHGEPVVAIGNAFGYEHTITRGIISQLHRDVRLSDEQVYKDLIQTDASINPGNSGGPLINADGDMIGLNVAIRAGAQGIGFAIPVDQVKEVLTRLLSVRMLNQIWHGLEVRTLEDEEFQSGRLLVQQVDPNSPAAKIGIVPGDRLRQIDGQFLHYSFDLERALLDHQAGESVPILFIHQNQERTVQLPLEKYSEVKQIPAWSNQSDQLIWQLLGVRVAQEVSQDEVRQISPELKGGLRIEQVARNSYAAQAGLQSGDILVGMFQYETKKIGDLLYTLKLPDLSAQQNVPYYYIRNGRLDSGVIRFSRLGQPHWSASASE